MDDLHNRYNDKMFDDLMQPLELNHHEKILWNDKCDYYCHGLKIRVFYFFYISKTLEMIRISFMASLLNAVL